MYQSPMGKVKTTTFIEMKSSASMYQSPMGKVKTDAAIAAACKACVSIPYGKGKEQYFVFTVYTQNIDLSTDNLPVLFLEVGFVTKSYLFC